MKFKIKTAYKKLRVKIEEAKIPCNLAFQQVHISRLMRYGKAFWMSIDNL